MFEIRRYSAEKADEWNQFVAESKNGTFLFDRRYMDYHSDRFVDHSLMFYEGSRLLAVLPAHVSGDTLCSHQGLTYGGLLMSPHLTIVQTMSLFREMNESLRAEGLRHVIYKAIPWIYHRLSADEDIYALFHECHARMVARDFSTNIFLQVGLRWERVRRRGIAQRHDGDGGDKGGGKHRQHGVEPRQPRVPAAPQPLADKNVHGDAQHRHDD